MANDKIISYSDRCTDCVFYFGINTCMAFMDKIPDEILHGDNPHTEPLENQKNNIVFEKFEFKKP
jgi:hypothetical protein